MRGAARERFTALLNLASDSPFEGERENALAAAERLAESHGLTLDEAANPAWRRSMVDVPAPGASTQGQPASRFANYFDMTERNLQTDKERREEAMRDAVARGLDRAAKKARGSAAPRKAASSRSQRSPRSHARVLLSETSFTLTEIVSMTGLDIYDVVGLKLKMRVPA